MEKIRCKYVEFPHPKEWDVGQMVLIKKAKGSNLRPYCSRWGKRNGINLSVFKERNKGCYTVTNKSEFNR